MEKKTRLDSQQKNKLLNLIGVLVGTQIALMTVTQAVFFIARHTVLTDRICSTILKLIIFFIFLLVLIGRDDLGKILPERFSITYLIATVFALSVIATAPLVTKEFSNRELFYLAYGVIVTPLFEELIFRGYAWEKLSEIFQNKWVVYILNAVFFGLWHLGYVYTVAFHMEANGDSGNLVWVMFMKVLVGFGYGLILGLVRMKTKNCYSTFLVHAILNVFAR